LRTAFIVALGGGESQTRCSGHRSMTVKAR